MTLQLKNRLQSSTTESSLPSIGLKEKETKLKPEIGIFGGISLVVGTMIGSGIFLSPAGILQGAQSVGASLCIWAGCGILCTLGALSYVELALMIEKSGGEYQYLRVAYGDLIGFMFAWTSILVTKPSGISIIAIGFAEYVVAPFFPGCDGSQTIQKCAAALCILTVTVINCYSVKLANAVQVFFTAVKLLMLFVIVISGMYLLATGHTDNFSNAFEGSATSFSALAVAFYSGLWSYEGWNQLNYVTEELQNPVKNFPLCIMIGIPLTTLLYVLVNVSYFSIMTASEVLANPSVAITFGDRVLGSASFLVPIAVACSTFGSANGSAFTGGRLTKAAGENGHMLKLFSYISIERLTPSPALIFNSFVSLIMILPDSSSFSSLIDYFTFASWIFYGATFLSVVVLRYRQPHLHRPYKVPIGIPIFCFICSVYLVVAPIVEQPAVEYLYAACFIMAGLVVYFPLMHFKSKFTCLDPIIIFLQQLLEVVPVSEETDVESIHTHKF